MTPRIKRRPRIKNLELGPKELVVFPHDVEAMSSEVLGLLPILLVILRETQQRVVPPFHNFASGWPLARGSFTWLCL